MASIFPGLCAVLALSMVPIAIPFASAQTTNSNQSVALSHDVQIPGANLKAGTYTFSVEGRLPDRAIVRIAESSGDKHFLVLSVPNNHLAINSANRLSFFKSKENNQAIRGWKCPACSAPLEFVYPKLEAVQITDASTVPVLAVDPSYDKLPTNLSEDDMKVVTLWLLSPERITAAHVGEGVKAAKYKARSSAPETTELASADARQHRRTLPKTASNTYTFLLCGLACFAGALALRMKRVKLSA